MEKVDTGPGVRAREDGRNNPRQLPAGPLWGVPEVAAYFGVTEETVRKWAREGDLPGKKVGRLWRFKPDTILRWVGDHDPNSVDT